MLSNFKNKKNNTIQQEEKQFVVFNIGEEKFGVAVNQIRQIIPVMEFTVIPNSPSFVKGVINLRGDIIPIIDLGKKLSLNREKSLEEKGKIIIVELDKTTNVGMLVDTVTEMIRINADEIATNSEIMKLVNTDYLQGVAKIDDHLLILLNLNKILSTQELLELGNIEI